ncbi:MAG TPA: hypothetical protein VMT76_10790 [Puia sp.]|nr:hypothetical protein [Puia sp.]
MLFRAMLVLIAGFIIYPQNTVAQKPEYDTTERTFTSNVPLNEINTKAFRHFTKNYPNVHDETWAMTAKEIIVSFTQDSKTCRTYYSKKGEFRLSVITYSQRQNFPEELKNLVSIGYPGSEIENIVELFNRNDQVYGITISNNQTFRLLEYYHGEAKIINEYIKQL